MTAVPADMPVTIPVDEPTVATEVRLLLQCPPVVPSPRVIILPTQTIEGPETEAGGEYTNNSSPGVDALNPE